MKKILVLFLAIALMIPCLTACDMLDGIFGKKSGVNEKYYENCAVLTFDGFDDEISIALDRTVRGEGTVYYQVNLEEGALSIGCKDTGYIHTWQPIGEFTADAVMPVEGSGGYVEGDEISITLEAHSPVSGEIIIAFTLDALRAVHKDIERHEHEYYYETKSDAHKKIYTCDCTNLEERDFEAHYDDDNDGECDECEYYMGKPHRYHDYYFDINEDSHMQVFTCGCVSEGFEPHYNNDGDEFCDVCGWNLVGHIHTTEKYQDEFGHGWAYTCGCDTPPNFAQHADGDEDGICDDCKYVMYEVQRYGFIYEKEGDSSYSIVGFYGDEDGLVEIPDYYNGLPVRYIRGNAFYGHDSITELIIGNNVYSIEGNAFMRCYNLKKVTFGSSLEIIDMQAFLGCSELEEIVIPASVRLIGSSVFDRCDKLKSVTLENPEGWYLSSDFYNRPFPTEVMSDPETVAKYFTETYKSNAWMKD